MNDNKWITLKDELTEKYIKLHAKSKNIPNDIPTAEIANILVGKRIVKKGNEFISFSITRDEETH